MSRPLYSTFAWAYDLVVPSPGGPSPAEVARGRAPEVDFEVADMLSWQPPAPFDGALCRGVLNDFVEDDERQRALDNLARMLRDGGLLVLDVRERAATAGFKRVERRLEGDRIVAACFR